MSEDVSFPHEKLEVWNRAVDFSVIVDEATRAYPADEKFGLSSQMRRASVSVSSNIAEGNARTSSKDKVRFVEIAFGSLMELVSQAELSVRVGFLPPGGRDAIRSQAAVIARQLSNLRSSLQRRPA